jgi:hypothetical protein
MDVANALCILRSQSGRRSHRVATVGRYNFLICFQPAESLPSDHEFRPLPFC